VKVEGTDGGPKSAILYVVATPIGNLGDLSPRARGVLERAGRICCEDTRRTRALLSAAGLGGGGRLVSLHAHNERQRIPSVLDWLGAGMEVALVSDAGAPGLSDPGSAVVAAVLEAGFAVSAVPGPSAVVSALSVSGFSAERFSFEGFLPRRGEDRRRRLADVAAEQRPVVLFEAPGRLADTLAEVSALEPGRPVVVVRELTKRHEELFKGTASEAAHEFQARPRKGEMVVVLGPHVAGPPEVSAAEVKEAMRERLRTGEALAEAAAAVATKLKVPRRVAYEAGVELRHAVEAADRSEGEDSHGQPSAP
jgi:16S rRNA (cytidine1402-2'-O)-methyltransferase